MRAFRPDAKTKREKEKESYARILKTEQKWSQLNGNRTNHPLLNNRAVDQAVNLLQPPVNHFFFPTCFLLFLYSAPVALSLPVSSRRPDVAVRIVFLFSLVRNGVRHIEKCVFTGNLIIR